MTETQAQHSRLQHFPIAWFAMIMGLGGLTVAWARAEDILGLSFRVSPWLLGAVTLLFFVIFALYVAKTLKYREAVAKEWTHPVRMNFVPALSISLVLLGIAWLPVSREFSFLLWAVGSVLHLILTLYAMTQWIHHTRFEIAHLNPAWFIPVVGNILVPIAGVTHAPLEISWYLFSIDLMFWPILLSIIFYRFIFHVTLPERLMPTLFILIAPPAVGLLSYITLTGEVDAFAQVLYNGALFFTLLLFVQVKWFMRLKFFLSWWAYSFPLAAITIATLAMFHETGVLIYLRLAGLLLGIATVVIAGLTIRTAVAIARREICVEE